MQLSKASVYAVFAVLHIARHDSGGPIQGRTIAEAHGIPPEYLLKILQQLARARIVQSERGPRGGFRLCRPVSEITLLEIIEATDGVVASTFPLNIGADDGGRTKEVIEELCTQSAEFARSLLQTTSIKQLLEADSKPDPEAESEPATPLKLPN